MTSTTHTEAPCEGLPSSLPAILGRHRLTLLWKSFALWVLLFARTMDCTLWAVGPALELSPTPLSMFSKLFFRTTNPGNILV